MKEIRTRPKGRDIQTRQTTAFLPKQAAKVLRENAARRQLTAKNAEQQEEAQSVFSEPASRFETTAQRAAEISARTAFRSGKALAQKQFDRAVISTKPKERGENAAPLRQSDPLQVIRAKQQFRQEQAKKQTERRRETVVREAKQEAFRVQDDFALQEHRFTDTPSSVHVDTPSVHTHRRRETASAPPQKAEKPPREPMYTRRQKRKRKCSSSLCRKPHKRPQRRQNAPQKALYGLKMQSFVPDKQWHERRWDFWAVPVLSLR